MKLGFELLANQSHIFAPHHKYSMYIMKDDKIIEESRGEDVFDFNGMILPHYPITATGRFAKHRYEPGLSNYYGIPGCAVEIPGSENKTLYECLQGMSVWLDNNSIMSQGELQTFFNLKVLLNDRTFVLPLLSPVLKVHWEGQGLFKIFLDQLLYYDKR